MHKEPTSEDLPELARGLFGVNSIWTIFQAHARREPDRLFFTWQAFDRDPVHYSYGRFEREVQALAAGLQRRQLSVGDRVLVHLENAPEFLVCWMACAAAGFVAVTTNSRSSGDELRYFVQDSAVAGAITQPRFSSLVQGAAPRLKWLACVDHDAGVPAEIPASCEPYSALCANASDFHAPAPDLLRPLSVQYTSGTTARPKGVVWTHANALWAARINALNEDLRADDCHFVYLPLFHTNSIAFSFLPSIWMGSRMLLTPKWSTSRFWAYAVEHGCTWVSLIGLSIRALLTMPPPARHGIRMFGTGVCIDAFPVLGVKTIGWWGMTETVSPGIVGDVRGPNRAGAIGRAATQYQIAVVDDQDRPVPYEQTGHLKIKGIPGLTLFAGYLGQPDATAASFDGRGWFRTGDLVTPHADGYYTFADRSKDMLRVGAENVAASEVERVIQAVPGVTEAAVVGRADEKLDEVPVAFLIARSGLEMEVERAVKAACDTLLADFKRPRAIYLVKELPRSTIAKINKAELRRVAAVDSDRTSAERRWIDAARTDPSGDGG